MAKRKSYWEHRMEQLYNAQDKRNNRFEKRLRKEYHRLEENIRKEIAAYYQMYGEKNVIEYRKLVQQLSPKERELLYEDYQEFSRRNPEYMHLMPIRESIYRLNRLEGLLLSIRMHMVELGAFEEEGYRKLLEAAYRKGYLSTFKGLQNVPAFFTLNEKTLEQTLNEKWINGENFSDRIWANKEKLINMLTNEIRDGFIRGDDYKQMSALISHRLNVGANEALRLIATESTFVMNQANKQAFIDAGIERYEYTAILDSRTSPMCEEMNGEIFKFEEAKVGINFPPLHPWCRSTIIPLEND